MTYSVFHNMETVYLCSDESLITTKGHRAAKLKLVTIPLSIDRDSRIMTFVLTKCYTETKRREYSNIAQQKKEPRIFQSERSETIAWQKIERNNQLCMQSLIVICDIQLCHDTHSWIVRKGKHIYLYLPKIFHFYFISKQVNVFYHRGKIVLYACQ